MAGDPITPQRRAELSAERMFANDRASQALGMTIEAIGPGRAVLSMTVRDDFLNGHDICHGGFIFTLADSAFAFACNSYNQIAVAHANDITFLRPGRGGDRLTATAEETDRAGRSGVYDVRVTNGAGETIALMRGLSRVIEGRHFEETT